MCSAHVMHTPIRLTPIHHPMYPFLQNRTSNAHTAPPGCPILENRTSKRPKTFVECPKRQNRTSRVAPLGFSYGKWRNLRMAPSYGSSQSFLPPRVAPLEFSYGKWRRDTPI